MRQFHTAVIERQREFGDHLATHPYEAGWAGEAIFFVRVEDVVGTNAMLHARAQISADGLRWVNEGSTLAPIRATGDYFLRVSHFGGWLRLVGEVTGTDARFKLTIQLVLKE